MNVPSNLSVIDAILLLKAKSEVIVERAEKVTHSANRSERKIQSVRERYEVLAVLTKEHDTLDLFAGMIRHNGLNGVDDEDTVAQLAEHASLIESNYNQVVQAGFILNAQDEAARQLSASVLAAVEEDDSSLIVIRDI